jgi:hypothetical protein
VAGAAFARRSDPRHAGGLSQLSRSERLHGARAAALPKADAAFWVQDYHFLALGAELRDLGVTEPIGFFLHTPWPSRAVIRACRIIAS